MQLEKLQLSNGGKKLDILFVWYIGDIKKRNLGALQNPPAYLSSPLNLQAIALSLST
jgi:hypothetical protein